jgi:hypothetical protein
MKMALVKSSFPYSTANLIRASSLSGSPYGRDKDAQETDDGAGLLPPDVGVAEAPRGPTGGPIRYSRSRWIRFVPPP